MKFLNNAFLIGLALTFSISAYAQDSDAVVTPDPSTPKTSETSNTGPQVKGTADMRECGRGYVVGVWPSNDSWYDWGVWLSEKGPSWSNDDIKFYRAYGHGRTDDDAGWSLYSAVMQAMGTGQMVAIMDDWASGQCQYMGTGDAKGQSFSSVQTWYP